MKKLEALGFDNSNPATNEEYNIIENWEDFPPNAYSSIVLLSFDIFSNREHTYARAGEDGFSITVPAYEVRYVGPQVFDSFININNGKLFEHR